ncbi:MAG: chorismate mutase [Cucumibacter sp.]
MTALQLPHVTLKRPSECRTKDEVRAEIDRLDQVLIGLFAERHTYVHRIAEIKERVEEAYDQARVDAVLTKVRERARAHRLDPDQAELLWRTLIDWNINFEKGIISARHPED